MKNMKQTTDDQDITVLKVGGSERYIPSSNSITKHSKFQLRTDSRFVTNFA